MSKRERLAQLNREAIVEAAERIFASRGYDNATMDDIARFAEYSKSTLYVYFKSKEEIKDYIVYDGMKRMIDRITEAVSVPGTFEERFYGLCFSLADFQREYPFQYEKITDFIEINFDEGDVDSITRKIYEIGETLNNVVYRFISDGVKRCEVRGDLAFPQAVFTFWGAITGIVRLSVQKERYIQKTMSLGREQFLKYSFELLYGALNTKNEERERE